MGRREQGPETSFPGTDWYTRRGRFILPMGDHDSCIWFKHGVGEGLQVIDLFEMTPATRGPRTGLEDKRAYLSPDGNWNNEPRPIHPPCTYEEAVSRLNQCALAPCMEPRIIDGEAVYEIRIWPVSDAPFRWVYDPKDST